MTLALACIARVHPELAPSGWQTELAFKEEDGLAPMFRAVLDSNPHSTHAIRLFVDEYVEDGLPTGALPHPRISSGRYGCIMMHVFLVLHSYGRPMVSSAMGAQR